MSKLWSNFFLFKLQEPPQQEEFVESPGLGPTQPGIQSPQICQLFSSRKTRRVSCWETPASSLSIDLSPWCFIFTLLNVRYHICQLLQLTSTEVYPPLSSCTIPGGVSVCPTTDSDQVRLKVLLAAKNQPDLSPKERLFCRDLVAQEACQRDRALKEKRKAEEESLEDLVERIIKKRGLDMPPPPPPSSSSCWGPRSAVNI